MKQKIENLEKAKISYWMALFLLASSNSSNLFASTPACQAVWQWGAALEPLQSVVTSHSMRPVQPGKKLPVDSIEPPQATASAKAGGGGAVAAS